MHGETFDLPTGSHLLCRGDHVAHQAICWGSALGFQFHLDMIKAMIRDWIRDRSPEERGGIMALYEQYLVQNRRLCRQITEHFLNTPEYGFSWI